MTRIAAITTIIAIIAMLAAGTDREAGGVRDIDTAAFTLCVKS